MSNRIEFLKLLNQACELNVAQNVLSFVKTIVNNGQSVEDALEQVWQEQAKTLCDNFPDIEKYITIDSVEAAWKEDMLRRSALIQLLASPNGIESLVTRVLTVASFYDQPMNKPRREILDETYLGHDHMYKVSKLELLDRRFSTWYLSLDNGNRKNLAKDIIRYGRANCKTETL